MAAAVPGAIRLLPTNGHRARGAEAGDDRRHRLAHRHLALQRDERRHARHAARPRHALAASISRRTGAAGDVDFQAALKLLTRRRIVLDTDIGSDVDDALCLALAVAAPEI